MSKENVIEIVETGDPKLLGVKEGWGFCSHVMKYVGRRAAGETTKIQGCGLRYRK